VTSGTESGDGGRGGSVGGLPCGGCATILTGQFRGKGRLTAYGKLFLGEGITKSLD